jgi:hypothetical protein
VRRSIGSRSNTGRSARCANRKRNYIDREHIVDRYLSGELSVREAREFEKYCLDHPEFLKGLPIPVRLKTRLSRQPEAHSETGIFQGIPSSATHAAIQATDEGFDLADEADELRRRYGAGGPSRTLFFAVVIALIAALAGLVAYGFHASSLTAQLNAMQRDTRATQMQPPGSVQTHALQLSRTKPQAATLSLGWPEPAQLLDLRIDASDGKYSVFQITIDRADGSRIMQIRRITRDSNRELRLALNSSAFGPGEFLFRFDGYNWRGQTEEVGWARLSLE